MRSCPSCSLVSPDFAQVCECGHAFGDQSKLIRAMISGAARRADRWTAPPPRARAAPHPARAARHGLKLHSSFAE
jgi:hypothetical protein